ncbi:hypothetical protein [Pseudogracilibacillus sp. SO30301A]|uniref:hypothetical protein n=1 Tax=Pseudogracilibacillus sp. SO30301A TaxID=3098291 RepID=UPI00300E6892
MSVNAEKVEIKSFEEAYEDAKNRISDLTVQELAQFINLVPTITNQNGTEEKEVKVEDIMHKFYQMME